MTLDTPTMFTCLMVTGFAGCAILLLFNFLWSAQDKTRPLSVTLWAAGFFLIGCGTLLVALRGVIPYGVSVVFSNGLILAGAGLRRCGFADFLGLRRHGWLVVASLGLWLLLCCIPGFHTNFVLRVNVACALMLINNAWIAWLAFRHTDNELHSVRLLGVTTLIEAAGVLWYLANQNFYQPPDFLTAFPYVFMAIYLIMLLFANIMMCVLPACMVIERSLLGFKDQALRDGQTGVLNRRAFLGRAQTSLSGQNASARYSVIVLQLDQFKSVNETFSNAMGDAVLRLLGRVLQETADDRALQGRLGTEEFVVYLPGADKELAMLTAQRISRKFKVACQEASHGKLTTSLSAGLVTTRACVDLDRAIEVACRGLQQAQQQGAAQLVAMDLTPEGKLERGSNLTGFSALRKRTT